MRPVMFSDTTLRDGEQMPYAALTPDDKVAIAKALVDAGIRAIDAGFPAAGQDEIDAIRRIVREVPGALVSGLARTVERDIDLVRSAMEEAAPHRRMVSLFIGASPSHREHKLRKSKQDVVHMATQAVAYARRHFDQVSFTAEDASRTETDFLHEVYRAAISAGATAIAYPDTVGILTPDRVASEIRALVEIAAPARVRVAVHFHNDLGLATANTLSALAAGASVAQCTVNGIGERAGNAALEEVAVALALNEEVYGCRAAIKLNRLAALSRLVCERTGIGVAANKAVVGSNIFLTEAGIHQDGLLKDEETYLPFLPEKVGAPPVRLILGKHSGRAGVAARLSGAGLDATDELVDKVLDAIKTGPKIEWSDERLVELVRGVERTVSNASRGALR